MAKQTVEPASPAAIAAAERAHDNKHEGVVTLSTGVVVRVRPVASLIISDIARAIPEPKIPRVYIETKAREEENPNDPGYLKALVDRETAQAMAVNDAFLLMGTEVVSAPPDLWALDSDDWIDRLALIGIAKPEGPHARYLAWMKYIAAPLQTDIVALLHGVGRLSAVTEDDVQAVADGFRRSGEGRADLPGSPTRDG